MWIESQYSKRKNQTLSRFAQHFDQLLNVKGSVDSLALDNIPNLPQIDRLGKPPMFEELQDAIMATRENKAPGGCGIPAKVWTYGVEGETLQPDFWHLGT